MDSNHQGSPPTQQPAPGAGIKTVLDPGLFGPDSKERYTLLRGTLTDREGKAPDLGVLDALMETLQERRIRLQDAIAEYEAHTDSRRWPIFVLRPNTDHKKLESRLLGLGFQIVPSLASAYRQVGLIPLRVPPEPYLLDQLSKRPDIQRIERSWLTGSIPQIEPNSDYEPVFPERLLDPERLPSALLSPRDPVRVGLLDSGIDGRHEALQTRLLDQRSFRRDDERVGDRFGHGTASAGIIARMCPSAMFLSARVVGPGGQGHLDEVVRALGWLRRQKPDLILCNLLMDLPPDGTSILSGLIQDIIDEGTPVLVPARDHAGRLEPPACALGILSVDLEGNQDSQACILARGNRLRVPRSIQADAQRFPQRSPTGWTTFDSPAAAAAVATGTACLLLKAARLRRESLSVAQLTQALTRHRVLDPQRTLEEALDLDELEQATLSDVEAPWELPQQEGEPPTMPMPTQAFADALFQTRPLHGYQPPTPQEGEEPTNPGRPSKKKTQ